VVLEQATKSWTAEDGIEKQWQSVSIAIVSTAANFKVLPCSLTGLLKQLGMMLYLSWLKTCAQRDLVHFWQLAKNTWLQKKAEQINKNKFSGKHALGICNAAEEGCFLYRLC